MMQDAITQGVAALRYSVAGPEALAAAGFDQTDQTIEKRRHVRFAIYLLGRFMRANRQEYPCRLNDISVGGLSIMSPVEVDSGERIIVYLDQLGGVEGSVARVFPGGFALQLVTTAHKREKLAAQITWLLNRSEIDGVDGRRAGHERIGTTVKSALLRLTDGTEFEVGIIDVSISGASVTTPLKLPNGTEVDLGRLRALVVRQHVAGVGLQFLDIQNPEALRRYFG
jgi:PilZ domain